MNHTQGMTSASWEPDVSGLIEDLILQERIMTLATAHKDAAWAAPVFYLYQKPVFYFFSSPQSLHIQGGLKSGNVAATIFTAATSWDKIRGLQMLGGIRPVPRGLTRTRVTALYADRFLPPKTCSADRSQGLSGGFEAALRRLYQFSPNYLVYMDNQIHPGFSEARIVTYLPALADEHQKS